jgi:5'-3' exonuclease
MLGKFKQELKDNFPYKVLDVEGAEADDIIGTLVPMYAPKEKILILSSDGDFLQLQNYGKNVKQYNPAQKKFIVSENPVLELKEKIIRGDKGDGIPNVFSPSDCFVRELRQKPITKGVLDKLMRESYLDQEETIKNNFVRNATLIDLTFIPIEIKEKIINTYDETKPAPKNKLLNYFIEKKLKNLIDVIEEF